MIRSVNLICILYSIFPHVEGYQMASTCHLQVFSLVFSLVNRYTSNWFCSIFDDFYHYEWYIQDIFDYFTILGDKNKSQCSKSVTIRLNIQWLDGQRNSASLGFTASDGTSVPEPNPAKGVYFGSGSFYSGPGSKPFKETDTTIFFNRTRNYRNYL